MIKKPLMIFAAIVVVMFSVSFTVENDTVSKPQKIYGIDIYAFSTPTREYTVIDEGFTNIVMGRCDGFASRSAKKAADQKGDAVILHFENYRYETIKYK